MLLAASWTPLDRLAASWPSLAPTPCSRTVLQSRSSLLLKLARNRTVQMQTHKSLWAFWEHAYTAVVVSPNETHKHTHTDTHTHTQTNIVFNTFHRILTSWNKYVCYFTPNKQTGSGGTTATWTIKAAMDTSTSERSRMHTASATNAKARNNQCSLPNTSGYQEIDPRP